MTNYIFKRLQGCAFARAKNLMSTKSETEFAWSVKLLGVSNFYVGIASHLEPECSSISSMDINAILYFSNGGTPNIRVGREVIYSDLSKQNSGDVIRFRFKPHSKKLVIVAVRLIT